MSLDRDAVLDAAAGVARTAGLDGLSLRAVAADLGVTPMALYRHVGDAASLHAATVERLLAGLPVVEPGDPWEDRCRGWALDARRVLAAAPGLPRHVLTGWTTIPRTLVAVDRLATLLDRHGPPGTDAVAAANVVFTYVLLRAQAEEEVRAAGVQRDLATLRVVKGQAPFVWANRRRYRRARIDEHFAYGLDTVLRGINAHP